VAGTRSPQGEANQTGLSAHDALHVVVEPGDSGPAVVRVSGEVDMLTAPVLAEQVRALLAASDGPIRRALVVDLTGVGFLGSAGLAVLADAAKIATERVITLRVVAASHAVLRPLQVAGLDAVLVIVDDLATAVEQCAS
jgi:anti-sigma B factor antagonist